MNKQWPSLHECTDMESKHLITTYSQLERGYKLATFRANMAEDKCDELRGRIEEMIIAYRKEVDHLDAENTRLRGALQFYANVANWEAEHILTFCEAEEDEGKVARAALNSKEKTYEKQ